MGNTNIELIREIVAAAASGPVPSRTSAVGMEATAGAMPPPDSVVVETVTVVGRPAEWVMPRAGSL